MISSCDLTSPVCSNCPHAVDVHEPTGYCDDCKVCEPDEVALYCDNCARFFAYYAFDLTPQGKKLKALERELEFLQKAGDWDAVAAAFARYNESNKAALLRYSE